MQTQTRKGIAFYLFYLGIVLLVASLPLSKFTMSIAQFLIAGGWLLDGNIKEKFSKFLHSRLALIVASVYVLHLIGLLYTTDMQYAMKDIRIKLPILILPLLLSTGPPISRAQFQGIIFALIGGVAVSTFISWLIFIGIVNRPVNDIRDICIFISHIRLALLCCLAIFASGWLIVKNRKSVNARYNYLLIIIIIWMIGFLVLLESLTGLIIIAVMGLCLLGWFVFLQKKIFWKIISLCFIVMIPFFIYRYVQEINQNFDIRHPLTFPLDTHSPSGNAYENLPEIADYENGYPIWVYINKKELAEQWEKRSALKYHSRDFRNQEIEFTIIRFLTSKGLRKDSTGIWSLSTDEVRAIESGIANVNYQGRGKINTRIHQVLWELHHYRKTGDPSGHSVAQRLEFWKAAVGIIKSNPVIGVGTGDGPDSFAKEYVEKNSKLSPEYRLRAHNQYLSFAVVFGITGLCWFLFTLAYPLILKMRKKDVLYVSFSIISIMSMLTEDTLETQAGVTFFALFTCIFLFVNPYNSATGVN